MLLPNKDEFPHTAEITSHPAKGTDTRKTYLQRRVCVGRIFHRIQLVSRTLKYLLRIDRCVQERLSEKLGKQMNSIIWLIWCHTLFFPPVILQNAGKSLQASLQYPADCTTSLYHCNWVFQWIPPHMHRAAAEWLCIWLSGDVANFKWSQNSQRGFHTTFKLDSCGFNRFSLSNNQENERTGCARILCRTQNNNAYVVP